MNQFLKGIVISSVVSLSGLAAYLKPARLKRSLSIFLASLLIMTPLMTRIGSAQTQIAPIQESTQRTLQGLFAGVISNQILAEYNQQCLAFRVEDIVKNVFPTIPDNPSFSPEYREAVEITLIINGFMAEANEKDDVKAMVQERFQQLEALNLNESLKDIRASNHCVVTSPGLLKVAANLSVKEKEELYKLAWGQVGLDMENLLIRIKAQMTPEQLRVSDLENLDSNLSTVIQALFKRTEELALRRHNSSQGFFKKAFTSAADLISGLVVKPAYAYDFTFRNKQYTFNYDQFVQEAVGGAAIVSGIFVVGTLLLPAAAVAAAGGGITVGGGAAVGGGVTVGGAVSAVTVVATRPGLIARARAFIQRATLPQSTRDFLARAERGTTPPNVPPSSGPSLPPGDPRLRLENIVPKLPPTPTSNLPAPPPSQPVQLGLEKLPEFVRARDATARIEPQSAFDAVRRAAGLPPRLPAPADVVRGAPPLAPSGGGAPGSLLDLAAKGAGNNSLNVPKFVPQPAAVGAGNSALPLRSPGFPSAAPPAPPSTPSTLAGLRVRDVPQVITRANINDPNLDLGRTSKFLPGVLGGGTAGAVAVGVATPSSASAAIGAPADVRPTVDRPAAEPPGSGSPTGGGSLNPVGQTTGRTVTIETTDPVTGVVTTRTVTVKPGETIDDTQEQPKEEKPKEDQPKEEQAKQETPPPPEQQQGGEDGQAAGGGEPGTQNPNAPTDEERQARAITDAFINFVQKGITQPTPEKIRSTGGTGVTRPSESGGVVLGTTTKIGGSVVDPANPDGGFSSPTGTEAVNTTSVARGQNVTTPLEPGSNLNNPNNPAINAARADLEGVQVEDVRSGSTNATTPTLTTITIAPSKISIPITTIAKTTTQEQTVAAAAPTFTLDKASLLNSTEIELPSIQNTSRCAAQYTELNIAAGNVPEVCKPFSDPNLNVNCSIDPSTGKESCSGYICKFEGGTCSPGMIAKATAVNQYECVAPPKECTSTGLEQIDCSDDNIKSAFGALSTNITTKQSEQGTSFTENTGANLCQPGYTFVSGFISSGESFGYFCNATENPNICAAPGSRLLGSSEADSCCAL